MLEEESLAPGHHTFDLREAQEESPYLVFNTINELFDRMDVEGINKITFQKTNAWKQNLSSEEVKSLSNMFKAYYELTQRKYMTKDQFFNKVFTAHARDEFGLQNLIRLLNTAQPQEVGAERVLSSQSKKQKIKDSAYPSSRKAH